MNRCELKWRLRAALKWIPVAWHDARQNRLATARERFLVVRHAGRKPRFYDVLLNWLEQYHPNVRARFELRLLPGRVEDWGPYVLCLPWLQDPVQDWSASSYHRMVELERQCDDRGIPVINRVERLTNAGKSAGARLIASAGIRTPRMVRIHDIEEFRDTQYGLGFPLLVREDWGHGTPVSFIDSPAAARAVPLSRFHRPVAVEFIDVRDPSDGLYHKYRYVAAGESGIALSIHPCRSWYAKGTNTEFNDALCDEEQRFISQPDPNHQRLQAARRALGLDFVAFDYSYDRSGRLVVWEANPFPHLHFGTERRQYRGPALERTLAAMARLYLLRAGLAVPHELERHLELDRRVILGQAA